MHVTNSTSLFMNNFPRIVRYPWKKLVAFSGSNLPCPRTWVKIHPDLSSTILVIDWHFFNKKQHTNTEGILIGKEELNVSELNPQSKFNFEENPKPRMGIIRYMYYSDILFFITNLE